MAWSLSFSRLCSSIFGPEEEDKKDTLHTTNLQTCFCVRAMVRVNPYQDQQRVRVRVGWFQMMLLQLLHFTGIMATHVQQTGT